MTWDRELDEFLTTTVLYYAPASMDVHGAQTYSTASRTVAARIEHNTRLVRDNTGREVASVTTLYLKPTDSNGTTWTPVVAGKVELPAGYDPITPPIIRVERHTLDGLDHWALLC